MILPKILNAPRIDERDAHDTIVDALPSVTGTAATYVYAYQSWAGHPCHALVGYIQLLDIISKTCLFRYVQDTYKESAFLVSVAPRRQGTVVSRPFEMSQSHCNVALLLVPIRNGSQ